jgi:5-methylcytosine-specific restriction endonuclease McrA
MTPKRQFWGKKNSQYKNCCYCELTIDKSEVTREHIIPKSKGGRIIAPCCIKCNREKGAMMLIDYIIFLWDKKLVDPKKIKRNEVKIKNAIKYLLLLYPKQYDFIFK